MNTTNAKVIRKYVDKFIPDHSMKAVYKWLKRYWLQLNAKDRYAFKKKMQSGYKIPANIKRRAGSEKMMLDWSGPGRKKKKSWKGRKIYGKYDTRR